MDVLFCESSFFIRQKRYFPVKFHETKDNRLESLYNQKEKYHFYQKLNTGGKNEELEKFFCC